MDEFEEYTHCEKCGRKLVISKIGIVYDKKTGNPKYLHSAKCPKVPISKGHTSVYVDKNFDLRFDMYDFEYSE